MPSYRIGFGSDFNLRDAKVGIGTTLGRTKLDVAGVSKADFNIAGVSTLTSYGGFVGQKQNVSVASTIGFSTSGVGTFVSVDESETGYLNLSGDFNTVSEDIIVDEGKIFQVSSGSTVSVGTLESVSIGTHFSVPNGGISARPDEPREGMVRFNDDLNTLEFYNGVEWRQFTVTGASGRGVFGGGGVTSGNSSLIEYINISSQGNAINFGNLTAARRYTTSCASNVRGIIYGGTGQTAIDYITIASEGNGISFGTANNRAGSASASSSTRGLFGGGYQPANPTNVIEYVQISTLGNPIDFGDLLTARYYLSGLSSPTRAVFLGGFTPTPASAVLSIIDFVTISSIGNAVRFGDLTSTSTQGGAVSSSTRGVYSGGLASFAPVYINNIDYITIATTGNATDFGDLANSHSQRNNGASTQIRGVFGGGYIAPGVNINILDYITIATTGNSQDFGDLSQPRRALTGLSDSHGGLGGF